MPRQPADRTDYDFVVVEALVHGRPLAGRPTTADKVEALRRLAKDGYTDGQAAVILGHSRRHIQRLRHENGIPSVYPARGTNRVHLWHPEAPTRPYALS